MKVNVAIAQRKQFANEVAVETSVTGPDRQNPYSSEVGISLVTIIQKSLFGNIFSQ